VFLRVNSSKNRIYHEGRVQRTRAITARYAFYIYATRLSRDYRATAYARLPRDMMKDRAHFLSPEADI